MVTIDVWRNDYSRITALWERERSWHITQSFLSLTFFTSNRVPFRTKSFLSIIRIMKRKRSYWGINCHHKNRASGAVGAVCGPAHETGLITDEKCAEKSFRSYDCLNIICRSQATVDASRELSKKHKNSSRHMQILLTITCLRRYSVRQRSASNSRTSRSDTDDINIVSVKISTMLSNYNVWYAHYAEAVGNCFHGIPCWEWQNINIMYVHT